MHTHCCFSSGGGVLYANIRHDLRSECNRWKSERSKHQWSWEGLEVFGEPSWDFRGWSTVRKFSGSKEHLDWVKTDLNAAEIITTQDYKHKKS